MPARSCPLRINRSDPETTSPGTLVRDLRDNIDRCRAHGHFPSQLHGRAGRVRSPRDVTERRTKEGSSNRYAAPMSSIISSGRVSSRIRMNPAQDRRSHVALRAAGRKTSAFSASASTTRSMNSAPLLTVLADQRADRGDNAVPLGADSSMASRWLAQCLSRALSNPACASPITRAFGSTADSTAVGRGAPIARHSRAVPISSASGRERLATVRDVTTTIGRWV